MEELQTIQEALAKKANFNADPVKYVPCLQCGRAIRRERLTEPKYIICNGRCLRRFNARMKADGHDSGAMMKRAFRDVFGISRGHGDLDRPRTQSLPLLPDLEAWLLYITRTMRFGGIEPYRKSGGRMFTNTW